MAGVVSVESACNLLGKSRLLKGPTVQAAYKDWRRIEPGPSPGEVDRFFQWLSANHYLTSYQSKQLAVGRFDHFFLNHYKLLDLIGQGGSAGIFKGAHTLGHIVSVKVLPPAKAKDPQVLGRFKREAKMAVQLKHPHIIRTFHLGTAGDRHYLVMEYLEGETLEAVLKRRGKLLPGEAVRLVIQTLRALQHVHEQKMVHRDLKPASLMLVPPRPPGAPDNTLLSSIKLLDIGVGRIIEEDTPKGERSSEELTTAGMQLGTADYMAPEQARDAHAVDIRGDIYSLGCVLYHALTGRPPFVGVGFDVIIKHFSEAPQPPKQLNPAIPEALQAAVLRMLEKDPGQRYQQPDYAAAALAPFSAPDKQADEASSLTKSYLQWVDAQPVEETSNAPTVTEKWYYSRNGLTVGPIATSQLPEYAAAGKLGPMDLLWMEGDRPDMAIPAKAALDFAAIAAAKANGTATAPAAPPPAPVAPPPRPLTKAEMGYDPDTGQVLDPTRFTKWQKQEKERTSKVVLNDTVASAAPGVPATLTAFEIYEKACRHVNIWLDLERNRRPIMTGDLEYLRNTPDMQRFMTAHARYGAEMQHKLWTHFQFMIENRRKYYCALG